MDNDDDHEMLCLSMNEQLQKIVQSKTQGQVFLRFDIHFECSQTRIEEIQNHAYKFGRETCVCVCVFCAQTILSSKQLL